MRLDRVAQHIEVVAIVAVTVLLFIAYIVTRLWEMAHG